MSLSADLSSWKNLLFFKMFTKHSFTSNLSAFFQSFHDPLYIVFENKTRTSLQTIGINLQNLSSYGFSLSLAFDDVQRAHLSILKILTYHNEREIRKPFDKTCRVDEMSFPFVSNEKNNVKKCLDSSSLNLAKASESILRLLVGLCLYEKINYVQGFLHILLNLCYLYPCPLYDIDSAFYLFHEFLYLASPHLLHSETSKGTSCKSQRTLCLLFHQLVQYHFPSVAYHIDRFHDTVFWNLHWFDCLGTTCFSDPLVWLDVWYNLIHLFFHRLKNVSVAEFHDSRIKLRNNNFCQNAMYCEWFFFTLAVISHFYQHESEQKSNYFKIGERVAQKLCAFNESDTVETWDHLWLVSQKKLMRHYDPERKDPLDNRAALGSNFGSNTQDSIPTHIQSMFSLRFKTPPFWLWRLAGHVPKNYLNFCQNYLTPLLDYSSFYCLPIFWKELTFWQTVVEEGETSSTKESCGFSPDTLDSRSIECCSYSLEHLSKAQLSTNAASVENYSHENVVNSSGKYKIGHEMTLEKDIRARIQVDDTLLEEYWSSFFGMRSFQRSKQPLFSKVILIPFDISVSSCYPINTPIGRSEDVIESSLNVSYVTILTPSRPESKVFRGFQRLCTSVNQESKGDSHIQPCWLSYSLDTTIALLRQWIQVNSISTPLFVIGNPMSSTNLNQYMSSSLIQDGVIQVVQKLNVNSLATAWLSYNIEPHPCQISFFLRCMESGIKYITLCPDFSSNSDQVIFLIRRILSHFYTHKCIQTPSSLFRRRIVKKPLSVPNISARLKNCSSVKSWLPKKASEVLFAPQCKKQPNNLTLGESKSIKSALPFQKHMFVRRVKMNQKKMSKPKELDPLTKDSSLVRNTTIFSWLQSFFQKKQEISQENIIFSPLEQCPKITQTCASPSQYRDLCTSVNKYRKMIRTPSKKNTFLTTQFYYKKKQFKKKEYFASWWKARKKYVINHRNLHLFLPYSKYKQFFLLETLKWETKSTLDQDNLNNVFFVSATDNFTRKKINSSQSTASLSALSKIVLWERIGSTDSIANVPPLEERIQQIVNSSLLKTSVQTFSPLIAFFRKHFLGCNDTLLFSSHNRTCCSGGQPEKTPHPLNYARNLFFYHHESSVLIMNATCHFIYETRLFCQILYFLFQTLSHARETSQRIMLYITKKDIHKFSQRFRYLMIENCSHMSNDL